MNSIMSWEECKSKHIRQVSVDIFKARSLFNMAMKRKDYLKYEKLDFKKIEQIYEILKELLSALMLLNGLKSDNHECIVSFFSHYFSDLDYESNVLHDLKIARNKIQYDGFIPRDDYLKRNELEFYHIISLVESRVLEKLGNS